MRSKRIRWRTVFVAGLLALSVADVTVWRVMARHISMSRWVRVPDLASVRPPYREPTTDVLPSPLAGQEPTALLQSVMNSVGSVAPFKARDFERLWEHASSGGGLLCRGMADLYYHVLRRNGVEARRVSLVRNLFDPFATHQTVEVEVDGRWVILDPTFNVSFEREGLLLGAQEIKEALRRDAGAGIRPIFHGEVSYPARLAGYYTHWLPLFDNVFVQDGSSRNLFVLLPPMRYWLGPVSYYQAAESEEPHVRLLNGLYFLVVALVPLAVISLAAAHFFMALRRRQ
ncbi:MAG: transglutaminase domain-containing protein [Deferrisomatales bacterium]|nr:transglutaminase domain-containing protein [Deferrisomatales bacterium]